MAQPLGGMNAALIKQGLEAGQNNSAISRETGAHKNTVRKMRKLLEEARGVEFLCKCGQRADHRDLCEFRRGPRQRLSERVENFFRTLRVAGALKR
jgi:transposase-like protein